MPPVDVVSKPKRLAVVGGMLASVALGALVASWIGTWRRPEIPPPSPVSHAVIDLPPDAPLALGGPVPQVGFDSIVIAISPDGSQLVYVGESGEGKRLYLRSMSGFDALPIPGTEDAVYPFFSPDGHWLGFLTTDKVKKVSLRGGAPMTLCDARTPVRASWTSDDIIYFSENGGWTLSRVPAVGGEPSRVMQSTTTYKFGQVLPDGKSVLVTDFAGGISKDYADILLLSLETLETKRLTGTGYDARYVPSGHLLFARSGSLMAVAFDLEHLEIAGEPVLVVSDVSMASFFALAQATFSENGLLAYVPGGDTSRGKLAWIDRRGETEFLPVPERLYGSWDLSPDGRRVAVHVADVNDYIWIYDIGRQEGRRLATVESAGWPVWTPDGDSIAHTSSRPGDVRRIVRRPVDGSSPPEELFTSTQAPIIFPSSHSPSGQVLTIDEFSGRGARLGLLPSGGPGELEWLQAQGSSIWGATFSSNGQWMAYTSSETGRLEIWVRSFPDGDVVRQISVNGGAEPVWCDEGELFYRRGNQWMSSRIALEPGLSWEPPRLVFETDFVDTFGRSYDVSPDGKRILVVKRVREPTRTKLHIISNWFEELERLAPTK